jgi:sec-independent protein translocase protein TatA
MAPAGSRFVSNPGVNPMNEWIIVGIIAFLVLVFGAKKLPELARGVGRSRAEFKRGLEDDD